MASKVYLGDGILAHGIEPMPRERTRFDRHMEILAYVAEQKDGEDDG